MDPMASQYDDGREVPLHRPAAHRRSGAVPLQGALLLAEPGLYAYVGNHPANRTDPSGLIAREAKELAAGLGGAISSGWSASMAAFQNQSLADMALKTVEGLNPTVGVAAVAGVKLLGAADAVSYTAMGDVNPSTGLNVIRDSSGNFLSGWKLNPQQLQHVLTSGKLGGG